MERYLIRKYLRGIDPEVFQILFNGKLTPEKAREITRNIDLDHENYFYAGVLAKLGMRDGFEGFREDLIPRLRGLYHHNHATKICTRHKYHELFGRLREKQIDFLCGLFLSREYRYNIGGLQPYCWFDVIVHPEDYQEACKIVSKFHVRSEDREYVWRTAKVMGADGDSLKTLSPTSLLLYSLDILYDITPSNKDTNEMMTARMRWLREYKTIDSDPEKIDFSILHPCSDDDLQYAVRFILMYAYTYYGETEKMKQLDAVFPKTLQYEIFLLKMYGRSFLP